MPVLNLNRTPYHAVHITPNRKVTFSWSVSVFPVLFFLKSCLLFHFLRFYFLLLFPCLFCCLMTFTSVLLSVLPLVVLTCVPPPSCINSVCLFPHGCLFRLIHRLWFARIIITTYYYHYLPTTRSSDLGQWSHGRCELASGWNGGGVISGTCGDKNPVDSVLICQGLSVWSLHYLPVSWWVLSRYSNFLPQLPPTVQASPTCIHHHWIAASDSARWVLDKQWFKKTSPVSTAPSEHGIITNKQSIIIRVSVCFQVALHHDPGLLMESSAAARHFRYTSATQRSENGDLQFSNVNHRESRSMATSLIRHTKTHARTAELLWGLQSGLILCSSDVIREQWVLSLF